MSNIVSLQDIREEIKKTCESNYVDSRASYEVLKTCLDYLNMNDMEELKLVKQEISSAMKKLSEISINGK